MSFREVRTRRGGGGGLGTSGGSGIGVGKKQQSRHLPSQKYTRNSFFMYTSAVLWGLKLLFFDVFEHVQNSIVSLNNL